MVAWRNAAANIRRFLVVSRHKGDHMSFAYIVLAHNNPRHLRRLLTSLASLDSSCFVHIDKKSTIDLRKLSSDTVYFLHNRIEVHWGDFSIVEATLALIERALRDPRRFDRITLLSGSDYPIRSVQYIECFFKRHHSAEFIDVVPMPSEVHNKPLHRLTRFRPRASENPIKTIVRKSLQNIGLIPRERDYKRALGGLAPYAGSQWWSLTRDACEYVERFISVNPNVVNFFRNTLIPDEMFFQTIVANSPFKENVRSNLTFADWSAGGPSPALLSNRHVELFASITKSGPGNGLGDDEILFARKFSDENQDVVNAINLLIKERDG